MQFLENDPVYEALAQTSGSLPLDVNNGMQVRQRWLALAHAAWLFCAALALPVFLAAIPLGYALRLSGASFGFPIDAPAWYVAAMSIAQGVASMLVALVSLTLAGILFWKKRNDLMTLLVSFYLLVYGIAIAGPLEALNGFPAFFPGAPTPGGMLVPFQRSNG